ncbi:hypothetical protein LTR53_011877 [Teratosphaeriaceae sp. CCFEE 6253]|nr:hypothetical protein LTR53_011877 [Teratosphaeriaceae sp. CCFEE 6253]
MAHFASSHPLYTLRKANIIIALLGVLFATLSIAPWDSEPFVFELPVLALSLIFLVGDLYYYAEQKKRDPDHDPPWPIVKSMLCDAILAVVLLLVFAVTVSAETAGMYRPGRMVGAWAALAALLCSGLHAYSLWKQLVARYKTKWLASISVVSQPCARCGYHEILDPVTSNEASPNTFVYVGTSATAAPQASAHGRDILRTTAPATTPSSATLDCDMEEGLLTGSDFGTGYGSIADPAPEAEPTLEQPAEILVGSSGRSKGMRKVGASRQHRVGETRAKAVKA